MKSYFAIISILLLHFLCGCKQDDDSYMQPLPEDIVFTEKTYSFANADRPYRRAEINIKKGVTPSLIVYLHGGSAKGDDNLRQMNEPAITGIAGYVKSKGIRAVFIVPQCPEKDNQGKIMDWVKMSKALEYLITSEKSGTDAKVYLFGGSMGGTGTWNMLSSYPEMFTAAMACAGNPRGCTASNVAKTPVYAVMGSSDKVMKPEEVNLQAFLDEVYAAGGKYKFDTEDGWDHERTCKESYTSSRLDWVFSHD